MATDRDLAIEACDSAFKDCINKITTVLESCLATAKDDQEKKECKERYEKGMRLCKDAHDINRETVDLVFPKKAVGDKPK